MTAHESERVAKIFRLDEFRFRAGKLPAVPIVIEADGTWHRRTTDDVTAAASRHPSAVARGRRAAN